MFLTEENYNKILQEIGGDNLTEFINTDVSRLHFTFGMHIRNILKMWETAFEDVNIHPDDLSYILLLETQNKLLKEKLKPTFKYQITQYLDDTFKTVNAKLYNTPQEAYIEIQKYYNTKLTNVTYDEYMYMEVRPNFYCILKLISN